MLEYYRREICVGDLRMCDKHLCSATFETTTLFTTAKQYAGFATFATTTLFTTDADCATFATTTLFSKHADSGSQ